MIGGIANNNNGGIRHHWNNVVNPKTINYPQFHSKWIIKILQIWRVYCWLHILSHVGIVEVCSFQSQSNEDVGICLPMWEVPKMGVPQ